VLHDDGNIARDHARKWRVSRDWFRIFEVVKAKVKATAWLDFKPIGTNGISVLVKEEDLDMGCFIAGIEDAHGFVARHLRGRSVAVRWDIPFGDGLLLSTDAHIS
jgi:hypothetical protein